MAGLEDAPERVRRGIVAGVLAYFLLFGYAWVADDPLAYALSGALFGAIAVGIGAILLRDRAAGETAMTAAGGLLLVGGLAQFATLGTRIDLLPGDEATFDLLATAAVFVGIGIYLFTGRDTRIDGEVE